VIDSIIDIMEFISCTVFVSKKKKNLKSKQKCVVNDEKIYINKAAHLRKD
jgi:hypothetical protein